ncbi:hypothetical protein COT12_00990, partial [Candidatus Berkelbacteria bacterium CG08_land_8_20_14_0_20_39_8]
MMLLEQIEKDYINAMKTKNDSVVSVLRMVKSALQNEKIKAGKELSNNDAIKIIQREIKQRKDSIENYQAGGRIELVKQEQSEMEILEKYLPEQLSDKELTQIVRSAIQEVGATAISDLGKVMGKVMPQV